MFSLCMRRKNKPSPMCNSLLHKQLTMPCIEKTYLLISGPKAKRFCSRGSMTVEAAVVIPLILLFFLHLGSVMEMIRLHGKLEYALWQVGREVAVYGASGNEEEIPDFAISYLYVSSRIGQILGEEYLDTSPLTYGSKGLNYLTSEYLEEEESIDIVITYQVSPQITCFPFPYFRMASRYYGRAWTGYAVGEEMQQTTYVYVAQEGEVWHSRADCSYLKLHIYEANPNALWMLRNENGEKYRACSRCADYPLGEQVYLTEDGNRYHTVRSCPSLQRRVHAIVWQTDLPYRPCSRCATAGVSP